MSSFFLILLLAAGSLFAQTDYTSEINKINDLLKDDFFISSGISISVYDLTENKPVFEKDPWKLLRPASNMKILTTAAGLLFLGEEYKFATGLWYTGSILNNILYGDLYVEGGCDPDFTTSDLDSLVIQIVNSGITGISGKIYFDTSMKDSLFWGNGWMWDDDPSTDAPYLSSLNINDNAVKIFLKPGLQNDPASIRTIPNTSFIKVYNNTITKNKIENPLNVTRDWLNRKNDFIASGEISESDPETAVILNVYNPEGYFAALFCEKLKEMNVAFDEITGLAHVPESAVKVASVERPFDSVLVNLNKISDNLSAEMVLYALSEKYYGRPASAQNGLKMIDSLVLLTGNDPDNYVFADGSGVSHYNLISAALINSILEYFYYTRNDLFLKLYNSFPSAGVDGTLRNRMRNTRSENNVHAKTGTLSGVSSLSGYLTSKNGNFLSFSIMIQNYKGSSAAARKFQDIICNIFTGELYN